MGGCPTGWPRRCSFCGCFFFMPASSDLESLPVLIDAHRNWLTLSNYRPRTVSERVKVLRAVERRIEPRHLGQATRLDLEAYLARDLSAEARRAYRSHLRGFYSWAVEEQYVPTDPTAKIPAIRVPRGGPRPIDGQQLTQAVIQADRRMRAWLLLMALGGLRCMEVAGLRPQDLIGTEPGVLLFLQETKGGGTGTVPAHPEVLAALSDVPIRNGLWWDVDPHYVSTLTARYLRSLGIQATGHQLRHFAGTSWYRASTHDLLTTSTLMRHRSLNTTRGYVALDPTRPAEVVGMVPRLRAV